MDDEADSAPKAKEVMPPTISSQSTKDLKPLLAAPKLIPGTSVLLMAYGGSVLSYKGDCVVNAANTGGITGFGIDEMVNRVGGPKLKEARRLFNGIPTGEAKISDSFDHARFCRWFIHAVGPVFRDNALADETPQQKDQLLIAAYQNSIRRACEVQAESIGFCLLSAGVFRGRRPLSNIIGLGLKGLIEIVEKLQASGDLGRLKEVCIFAFTKEEQVALQQCVNEMLP